jgi:hypothetical protein
MRFGAVGTTARWRTISLCRSAPRWSRTASAQHLQPGASFPWCATLPRHTPPRAPFQHIGDRRTPPGRLGPERGQAGDASHPRWFCAAPSPHIDMGLTCLPLRWSAHVRSRRTAKPTKSVRAGTKSRCRPPLRTVHGTPPPPSVGEYSRQRECLSTPQRPCFTTSRHPPCGDPRASSVHR